MGATSQQKMMMCRMMKNAILQLCNSNRLYDGQLEIDGIICISGQSEGQELVIKLHEKLGLDLTMPGLDSNDNIDPAYKMALRPEPDLSQGYPSDDEQNHSRCSEPETALDMTASHNNSVHNHSSGMDIDDRSDHNSTIASVDSPPDGESSHMGPRGLYLGKLPYLSSPALLQKKLPLRSDRWTPGTPLPTTPECKHCGYTFASFDVLSEHNEAVHSVFTCQYCFKTFTSRSNLERHSRLHTGHRPYVCSLCGKAFSRKDHLTNHSTKHAFKCGTCLKRFTDKKQLTVHYTSEHGTALSHVCEFCNKGFGTSGSYDEHVKTHPQYHATRKGRHGATSALASTRRHVCRMCQFSCNDRITLIKHKMMHGDSHRCFTCLSCAKMFSNPLQYSNHLYTHGSEVNIFECCMCRQIYPTLESLKKHELVHVSDNHFDVDMNSNYFSCSECGKVFQSETNLHEHMEIHDSVNNKFRCAVCSQGFPTYTDLWKHTEDLKHYAVAQPLESATDAENNYIGQPSDQNDHNDQTYEEEDNNLQKGEGEGEVEQIDDSDVEIVEPQAPDEDMVEDQDQQQDMAASYEETPFVITENPLAVIEVSENSSPQIQMHPVKSMLSSRSSRKQGRPQRLREILPKPPEVATSSPLILEVPQVSLLQQFKSVVVPTPSIPETTKSKPASYILSALQSSKPEVPSVITVPSSKAPPTKELPAEPTPAHTPTPTATPAPYIEIKPDEPLPPATPATSAERSESPAPSTSTNSSPIKAAVANIEVPAGPAHCSLCSSIFDTFHEMETHCLQEHTRSPCMFCAKTFAQKANRDRHLCLHTGDKPYSCPDCDEKFSRGDKLKIHRTKVHNYTDPPSRRSKQESASPSPAASQDRSSLSPVPLVIEEKEDWAANHQMGHETVSATGEWTVEVTPEKTEPVH